MTAFGSLPNGHDIDALNISGHGLTITVLTYGAILQNVRLDGIDHSLTVGSNRLQAYLDDMTALWWMGSNICWTQTLTVNTHCTAGGVARTIGSGRLQITATPTLSCSQT